VDTSEQMLKKNQSQMPDEFKKVEFVVQELDGGTLRPEWKESFDLICCRQGVVCFVDPMAVFVRWHHWLKPSGKLLILDALWTRSAWNEGDWAGVFDYLPLSCTQSLATIPYLLELSGFNIEHNALLPRVNALFSGNEIQSQCPRFAIVASKRK
jgi:ubiquinone/menaquinone biosynthesis C-methylase UbiE